MANPPASPGFITGQVLPADQLNSAFVSKQDYPAITQSPGTSDTTIATTAFVQDAVGRTVTSFNSRTGPVALTAADVTAAGGAPITSPAFNGATVVAGAPTAPTQSAGTSNTSLATTAFVAAALAAVGGTVAYWKDMKKDFGAAGDGVTDDSAAFLSFTSWAIAQTSTVYLVIPPGTYILGSAAIGPTQPRAGSDFFRGIKNLVIWGYGATLSNFYRINPYSVSPPVGGAGYGAALPSFRINAASAGATSVTLKSGSVTGIAVGDWVTVTSLETQGTGTPPSWQYFEYKKVSAFTSTTITFADPLMYTHLDTYPVTLDPAAASGTGDLGGPATVMTMQQDWDQTVVILGLSFKTSVANEFNLCCRRGHMIDCANTSAPAVNASIVASTIQDVTFERCALGTFFECDKNIGVLKIVDCDVGKLEFQVCSFERVIVDGCNVSNQLLWISKNTEIKNSNIGTMSLYGPGIGAPNSCIIDNCHIGVLNTFSNTLFRLTLTNMSFAGGRFSMLKTLPHDTYRLMYSAVPGSKMFFSSMANQSKNFGNPFVVLAMGEDATTVWIDTTLTALPTYTAAIGVPDCIVTHPCHRMSARSISGDLQAVQIAKAQPETPLYSYIHSVYGADLAFPVKGLVAWGTLVSLIVNVIIADTGTNPTLTMKPCGQFGAYRVDATNTVGQYNPVIDLKTAGKRVITPTAVSGSAGADQLGSAPGNIWFMDVVISPYLSGSVAGETAAQMPLVEIEVITDQGVTKLTYNALAHA